MAKRILFACILALQLMGAVSVASAEQPWPCCFPCNGGSGT
jgi:hypothetical protein